MLLSLFDSILIQIYFSDNFLTNTKLKTLRLCPERFQENEVCSVAAAAQFSVQHRHMKFSGL